MAFLREEHKIIYLLVTLNFLFPLQYEHYFDSTYKSGYDTKPREVPETLKHLKGKFVDVFFRSKFALNCVQIFCAFNRLNSINIQCNMRK